jgi:hypothetical protein
VWAAQTDFGETLAQILGPTLFTEWGSRYGADSFVFFSDLIGARIEE